MKSIRLNKGDEIRVIAPSQSWNKNYEASYTRSIKRMESAGFKLTFSNNIRNVNRFGTATVSDRLKDMHEAYGDKNVKAIWCVTGGWSANELLPHIDWDIVTANPKPLMGFSDITVLLNAIYAKTGQVGLLSPNFGSIGRSRLFEYSLQNLTGMLQGELSILQPSRKWAVRGMKARKTRPWKILVEGNARGKIIGGNLGTFYLLQGTKYQPIFNEPIILLAEDDDESGKYTAREFDRRLESILQLPGARENITGVLIGRFQLDSRVTMPDIIDIVERKFGNSIPVFADLDFGHTAPNLSLPIGGIASMSIKDKRPCIELIEY